MSLKQQVRTAIIATLLTLGGCLLSTTVVRAGQNEGMVSLSGGVDFVTAYYFRGIFQEKDGFIAQPYGDVTFNLYDGGQGFNSLSTTLGIWNSFQSAKIDGTTDPRFWYEADLYGGIAIGFLDVLSLSPVYTAYTSPNGAFSDVQELSFNLSFDDSKLLGPFAMSPYILLAFEVDGQADGGSDEGVYMEIGIEPAFTLYESPQWSVAFSFPLKVGLSLHDYYEDPVSGSDSTFGYFDGGIALTIGLGFIPADFGSWSFSAAGHFLAFGDSLETFNSGDSFQPIGSFGLSLTY